MIMIVVFFSPLPSPLLLKRPPLRIWVSGASTASVLLEGTGSVWLGSAEVGRDRLGSVEALE